VGAVAIALGTSAHADPGITGAAIATGRLYVVGTTDQPHTSVSLDEKFTVESDDKGKFQFDLVYYPSGCVVRATVGAKTYQAQVEQCGMKCGPERVAAVETAPAKGAKPVRAPVTPPPAPQRPPIENQTSDAVPVPSQLPAQTGTLHVRPALVANPIAHPPLPPQRPTEQSAVVPSAAMRAIPPLAPTAEPRLNPRQIQRGKLDESGRQEPLSDPDQPDDIR
jgi:hypothetical protein